MNDWILTNNDASPSQMSLSSTPVFSFLTFFQFFYFRSHPFFRASFPNLVVLVNHWCEHPRGFPKWYIRKYSVWHFLRNRPIVEISGDFHNKLTIFSAFCPIFHIILTPSG